MFAVTITEKGGAQKKLPFNKKEVTIGRIQGNDVVLPKGNVSKRHSRIVLQDSRFIVVDLKSTNGTYVNGRKINSPLVVKPGDKIYIGDFILTLEGDPSSVKDDPATSPPPPPDAGAPATVAPGPDDSLSRPTSSMPPPKPDEGVPSVVSDPSIEEVSLSGAEQGPARAASRPPVPPVRASGSFSRPPSPAQLRPRATMPSSIPPPSAAASPVRRTSTIPPPGQRPASRPPPAGAADDVEPHTQGTGFGPKPVRIAGPTKVVSGDLASCVHEVLSRLSAKVNLMSLSPAAIQKKKPKIQRLIGEIVTELARDQALGELDPRRVVACTADEAMGYGPIDLLLVDEAVQEIVVEAPQRVMVDRGSGPELHPTPFSSQFGAELVAERLRETVAGKAAADRPIVRGTLPSGEQVTVIMPSVAAQGLVIEVRRRRKGRHLSALVEAKVLDQNMADLLIKALIRRRNIAIIGQVSAGVTELLGAIVSEVGERERIVTVEQVPDMVIDRDHVITLGVASAGATLTLPQVLADAILLRTDRIVVDDIAASDVLAVLNLLATRGNGCLMGLHAGTEGGDPISALRVFAEASSPGDRSIDELIALGVQLVVRLGVKDGTRRVLDISEVRIDNGVATVHTLFRHNGSFQATEHKPSF